ncbi:MAG: spore germination protein GerW family protein [Bacillota bacterium]|nr:spore germination protein GerW family protein [Bacillota bacterium]
MEPFGESLGALGQSIERLISSKTVIGDPIKIGDITLVPVVDVVFGLGSSGAGASSGASERECGKAKEGHAVFATGARVSPRALIVVKADQVEVYPLSAGSPVERILDRLPMLTGAILDKIRDGGEGEEPGDWR